MMDSKNQSALGFDSNSTKEREIEFYRRKRDYLFCPMCNREGPFWMVSYPGFAVSVGVEPEVLGQVVLIALNQSKPPLPHCRDEYLFRDPLLSLAGVKGRRGFLSADILALKINQSASGYKLVMMKQTGPILLESMDEGVLEFPPSLTAKELGEAISFALDQLETRLRNI